MRFPNKYLLRVLDKGSTNWYEHILNIKSEEEYRKIISELFGNPLIESYSFIEYKPIKVEVLEHPTDKDWLRAKQCTLNTVGKKSTKLPPDEWKVKLLESEHSPIRTLMFLIKMEIPYWVSVHFCRHKIGVEHFVQTQRTDRTGVNRNELPQGQMVSHMMWLNAGALIYMARKRLCKQASKETREVMQEIVRQVLETNPEFKSVLVPNCVYRNGKCTEFYSCKEVKDNE